VKPAGADRVYRGERVIALLAMGGSDACQVGRPHRRVTATCGRSIPTATWVQLQLSRRRRGHTPTGASTDVDAGWSQDDVKIVDVQTRR